MSSSSYMFKIILIGPPQVGKSAFIKTHAMDKLELAKVTRIDIKTTIGIVTLDLWDCHDQTDYTHAHAAIIISDITHPESILEISKFRENVNAICGDIPVISCINKLDLINTRKKTFGTYCCMSVKNSVNINKPFLDIIRILFNDNSITLNSMLTKSI